MMPDRKLIILGSSLMTVWSKTNLTPGEVVGLGLAILLSGSAGIVDAIAHLQFDHVFVANMTGNTVLFGIEIVLQQAPAAISHLIAILAFLAGIVVVRFCKNLVGQRESILGPAPVSNLCFLVASALWTLIGVLTPSLASLLIPVLAFSMGAQNATFRHVGKIPVNTAFITGDLEKLGETIANLVVLQRPDSHQERLKVWAVAGIWIGYGIGAALGALSSEQLGRRALLFPAAVVLLCAIIAFVVWNQEKRAIS
jgi:uncharacterized membrane protein YoaK (UPF0700 family)